MLRKNAINFIILLFLIVIVVTLFAKNCSDVSFWSANFMQILTFVMSIIVSFCIVQLLTDKRRKIDCVNGILMELKKDLDNEILFSIDREALLIQQSIANKILYLKQSSFKEMESEFQYIKREFEELRSLYAEHNKSAEELYSIKPDISRHKHNIKDKCDKIILALFDL